MDLSKIEFSCDLFKKVLVGVVEQIPNREGLKRENVWGGSRSEGKGGESNTIDQYSQSL